MKFIILSVDGTGFGVAYKLQKRGLEVIALQVKDKESLRNADDKKEDPKIKERRLKLFDGLLRNKEWAEDFIKRADKMENKTDYFVFPDTNRVWYFTEKLYEMGFTTGMFPTEEDRILEEDREKAKKFVEKHYDRLKVRPSMEFKKIADGIKFLQETDKIYVLKSNGEAGRTIVPKSEDPQEAAQELIPVMEKEAKDYQANGYILEEKIIGWECVPELVFYDGKLVFSDVDIETKYLSDEDRGPQVGCGSNLIIKTPLDCELNKIAFPKIIFDMAKKHPGMFIIDAGIIYDGKDFYFTEFCFNRAGWDSFPTELAMAISDYETEGPEVFFERVLRGENPLANKIGTSVRMFNVKDFTCKMEGIQLNWDADLVVDTCIWLYDAVLGEGIETTGVAWDTLLVTGVSDGSIEAAVDDNYEYIAGVRTEGLHARSHDDFLSTSYRTAIMSRYNKLKKFFGEKSEMLNGRQPKRIFR